MKNLYIVSGITILLLLFPQSNFLFQVPQIPDEETLRKQMISPRSSPPCYTNLPVDLKAEKLSVNYYGNDLEAILRELARRESLQKNEFETTKQFGERLKLEKEKNFVGDLNGKSVFAFIPNRGKFRYDADTETMIYEIELSSDIEWSPPCSPAPRFSSYSLNAKKFIVLDRRAIQSKFGFKMEIEKARKTKPDLKALIVGLITETDGTYYKATTGTLYENKYSLYFEPLSLWLYDFSTGEFYFRLDDGFEKVLDSARTAAKLDGGEFSQVKKLYEEGEDGAAMTILRRILIADPMEARAYFWLGKIQYRQNEVDMAISSFRTALLWDNRIIEAYIILAEIFLKKRDCSQAQNYARAAQAVDADNPELKSLQPKVENCRY